MARNWGHPAADSQQETEALSLTAHKELNAMDNYRSLEVYPSPVKPSDENPALTKYLQKTLKQSFQLNHIWDPDSTDIVRK